jgi:hypothetical protein
LIEVTGRQHQPIFERLDPQMPRDLGVKRIASITSGSLAASDLFPVTI